jgi:hypothetical protein
MKPKTLALMGTASFCVRRGGHKRYNGQQEIAPRYSNYNIFKSQIPSYKRLFDFA